MKSEKEIARRASRLLQMVGTTNPPVDVKAVAHSQHAQIRYERADDELSGALYRLPDSTIIGVNKNHPTLRQRFTIAHEIGHLILHDQAVFIDRSFPASNLDGVEPRFRRDALSGQAVDNKEIEANRFAAALLMPESLLRPDVAAYRPPLTSADIQALAKRYQVSFQAMMFRVMNLGVPIEQI